MPGGKISSQATLSSDLLQFMRETNFINQNKDKWEEYEEMFDRKTTDPDRLNRLFVQITDDLSYSRTFYPNRSVRVYLNNLAQQIFYNIYRNKKSPAKRLVSFWTDELPRLVYESRSAFRIAFAVFILSMIIGAFSAEMDPEFPRVILGDSYVDMTIENIETGDPMAVYKDRSRFGMALGITANNLFVAFLTFLLGAFFCVGAIGILINNGVMVGSFQHFFYDKGVFQESFLTIWTHGTLEISAIIIAGAAGITMGQGLVFPGTLSRLQAFQISARRGLKIMVGLVPIFIVAGFIEGYLTRYTDTPDTVRLRFILICLFFIVGYFVIYPIRKARTGFKTDVKDTRIPPTQDLAINYHRIKFSGEILTDSFSLIRKNMRAVLQYSAGFASVYVFVVSIFSSLPLNESFYFPTEIFGAFSQLGQYFNNENIALLPVFNILMYTVFFFLMVKILLRDFRGKTAEKKDIKKQLFQLVNLSVPVIIGCMILATDFSFKGLVLFALIPLLLMNIIISQKEGIHFFAALGRSFGLMKNNPGQTVSLLFLVSILGVLLFSIMDTSILWFYLDFIGWNVSVDQTTMNQLVYGSLIYIAIFILCLVLSLFIFCFGLLYFSLLEIAEAPWLHEAITRIGQHHSIRGLEKEG